MSSSRRSSRASTMDTDFHYDCKAAYVSVVKSVQRDIKTKDDLIEALQVTGRNPSQRTLKKYWTPNTTSINFDRFCKICEMEEPTSSEDLIKAFKKIDINGDGFISCDELLKVMTSKGEKMTRREVEDIIDEVDKNGDGKLDYDEYCTLMANTVDEVKKMCRKSLEHKDRRKRTEQFAESKRGNDSMGSQLSIKSNSSHRNDAPKPSPRTKKQKYGPAANLSSLTEPRYRKLDDHHCHMKGGFYLDEKDLVCHQYKLKLRHASEVYFSIQPIQTKSMIIGTDGLPIDTALYIERDSPDEDGNTLVTFTEQRDSKGKYGVKCDLEAGTYYLVPFTTGSRLKPRSSTSSKEVALIKKDREGNNTITKAFRRALEEIFDMSDLDGNGYMSKDEFSWFNFRTSDEKLKDDEWEVVKDNIDLHDGELTKNGFVRLNEMEAEDIEDDDTGDLWVTLTSMGYNKELFIDECCPFEVNVYTEERGVASLSVRCIGKVDENMIINSVIDKGEAVKLKGMKDLYMYTYTNSTRSTIVIQNKSYSKIKMQLDCGGSKNCISNHDTLQHTLTLQSQGKAILHHLTPADEMLEWAVRCTEMILK